ncbi:penicillin-binding transpeptidase domain-containing protein [Senegalia massiliensis]|uniref:penicillin-binding transpeptidase domain-containing protein n=1 Tax=Senegalia massiliensis TaxID=1720316 RepID=UPI001030AFFC|nr:penicillin-binding transpeptidase domain-containing protein [Senegalia massiliensis]
MEKLIDKLKNRYSLLIIIMTVIFSIMAFKLAEITIIHGDEYREKADNTKVKKIPTPAPRGNILDVNGKVLAENRTGFTVQIMKDEFTENDKNVSSIKIMSLLEKQGENYIDDFPITLNSIDYKNEKDFFEADTNITDDIAELLIKNGLVDDLLDMTYEHITDFNEYRFSVANRALSVLIEAKEVLKLPIKIDYKDGKVDYKYREGEDIESWKEELNLSKTKNPKSDITQLLLRDNERIKSLIGHPIVRKFSYELLDKKGKVNNYKLVEYKFSFDNDYRDIKKNLMSHIETEIVSLIDDGLTEEAELELFGELKPKSTPSQNDRAIKDLKNAYPNMYPSISFETSAKQDFITLLKYRNFKEMMSFSYEKEGENTTLGLELLSYLKNKNIETPFIYEPDGGNIFEFTNDKEKNKFINKNNLQKDISADVAVEIFVKKEKLFDEFVILDDIKVHAQRFLLQYINPKISISKWEYTSLIDKEKWIEGKNIKKYKDAEDVFEKLVEKSDIDKDENITDELNIYEKRFILLLNDLLTKQGYRAYEPITIAYNIKDETVAMIKERNMYFPGIKTSLEPLRYYPMGETAAHTLGYLGKISQQYEIEKYINDGDYSRNDIIGKTGIEQEFEDYLNGKDGYKLIEVDAFGNTHRSIDEEEEAPIPGNNIKLTIDYELQKKAEESLKETIEKLQTGGTYESEYGNYKFNKPRRNAKSGATVALNVKTGEVLAIANYPSYDPNLFSTGITLSDYENLKPENEKDLLAPRPLFNLALRSTIPPGSSFKMLPAIAGLEKGLNPYKKVNSLGTTDPTDNDAPACWIWNDYGGKHGPTNMYEAIEESCNYYFYTLAEGRNPRTKEPLGVQVTIEDMQDISRRFGLDEKTGIEIPEEKAGSVPNEERKLAGYKIKLKSQLSTKKENLVEGKKLKDKDIDELIDIFTEWANRENMSPNEVIDGLEKLGIVEDEIIPLKDYLVYTYFKYSGFVLSDAYDTSIGQGQNNYTPIGIANMVATIANGGYKNELTIIDDITSYDGKDIGYEKKQKRERIELKDYNYLEEVKQGMLQVVENGSVRSIFNKFPVKVAGKTGTAQAGINPVTKEFYDNYAWFVGFAPYDDPEIAVATVIFQGGSGGNSAPMTRDIIGHYLEVNKDKKEEK